jgi:hypothetical protein
MVSVLEKEEEVKTFISPKGNIIVFKWTSSDDEEDKHNTPP